MIYGDEKVRQMVRSILPSTGRKSAKRMKAELNRRIRRNARQALHEINNEEAWLDDNTDFWDDGQCERTYLISIRRGYDKINHFMEWAEHKAKDIPDGEKMGHIKGIVKGRGVIIEHALGHLEGLDGFDTNTYHYSSWRYSYVDERPVLKKEDVREILHDILSDSRAHKGLNNLIKNKTESATWYSYEKGVIRYEDGEPILGMKYVPKYVKGKPTLLLGAHNIDKFIRYYKRGVPTRISGNGKDYGLSYNSHRKYVKAYLPNPASQPQICNWVKEYIETYKKDSNDRAKLFHLFYHTYGRHSGRHVFNWKW